MTSGTPSSYRFGSFPIHIGNSNIYFTSSPNNFSPMISQAQYPFSSQALPAAQPAQQAYQNLFSQPNSQAAQFFSLAPTHFPFFYVPFPGNPPLQISFQQQQRPVEQDIQMAQAAPATTFQTQSVPVTFSTNSNRQGLNLPPLFPPPLQLSQSQSALASATQSHTHSLSCQTRSRTLAADTLLSLNPSSSEPPQSSSSSSYEKAKKRSQNVAAAAAPTSSKTTPFYRTHFQRFYQKGTEVRFGERNKEIQGTLEEDVGRNGIIKVKIKKTRGIEEVALSQLKPMLKVGDCVLLRKNETNGIHVLGIVCSVENGGYQLSPMEYGSDELQNFLICFKTRAHSLEDTILITKDAQLDGLQEVPVEIQRKLCKGYKL